MTRKRTSHFAHYSATFQSLFYLSIAVLQVTVAECAATNGHKQLEEYLSGVMRYRKQQPHDDAGRK